MIKTHVIHFLIALPQMACMEGYIITLITFLHFPFSNVSSRCLHKWTKNCINYNSFDFLRCGFSMVSLWHFYQSTKSHTNCICLAFVQCSMTPVTPETPRLPRLLSYYFSIFLYFRFTTFLNFSVSWGNHWKAIAEKIKRIVIDAIFCPIVQASWGHIWKRKV